MSVASRASNTNVSAMSIVDASATNTLSHSLKSLQAADNHLLMLGNMLQSSLEPETILELFAQETSSILAYNSLAYTNPKFDIEYQFGDTARHSCEYTLDIQGNPLGHITLTRSKRFTKADLTRLENLLCILIYPLHNALRYHQALLDAKRDSLTGLRNRAALDETLVREVKLAQRHDDKSLSLIVLDIDHFKGINDSYGHATGDCLIRACADIIQATIRSIDIAFRYGGEEFVIVLSDTQLKGARKVAERIRKSIMNHECHCSSKAISMTASLGVTTLQPSDTEKTLFLRADKALYQAKHTGRNCTVVD